MGGRGGSQEESDSRDYQALMHEVSLLGSLMHPNIMRFLAVGGWVMRGRAGGDRWRAHSAEEPFCC